ncbi:MAG TPA: hypothetical protein DIW30_04985, partial [Bacteroidales bacterium]|nr:hypothetical protein [Bacteroidales bacterium]
GARVPGITILAIRVLLFQDAVGDVVVVGLYFLFSYPVEGGHNGLSCGGRPCPRRPVRIQKTWATIPIELATAVVGNLCTKFGTAQRPRAYIHAIHDKGRPRCRVAEVYTLRKRPLIPLSECL